MVMNRLAAPWQLIRIATRAADSDDTARIAETPYAMAVTIVLDELECMVGELRSELKAGRPVASMLKSIHDAAREMRTEMDLSVDSAWARQLAAVRSAVSNLLTAEIEAAPGRVRRLLRPRPAKEIVPGVAARCHRCARGRDAGRISRRVPPLRGRAGGERSDAADLFGTYAISRDRHQGPARCVAPCRGRRAAVPAVPGRRRDPLLPDGVRRRLCRAAWPRPPTLPCRLRPSSVSRRERKPRRCGAAPARVCRMAAPRQCAIAAPTFPLQPHSRRDVTARRDGGSLHGCGVVAASRMAPKN